jgi:CRISPR-associated exonuclease Cas4
LTELQSTLLVEAAAGTGKTSLLAGRVVMLLADGVSPASIAAITFTELAAGELRQRVAQYLDVLLAGRIPEELRLCLGRGLTAAARAVLQGAAAHLDELTCSTIHGFCHDLLRTYAVEAAIDPGAEVLDRDQADFVFGAIFGRWWRDRLSEPRPSHDPIALMARKDPRTAEELLRDFAVFRRRYRKARPLPPNIDAGADREFVERVREFRLWCNRVDAPAEADTEIGALETLASHFERRFDFPFDFERLWDLAHPEWLSIMRKDSFDLRGYRRRSMWKRAGGKEAGERLADQAEEHYARCREAYCTLMGRIATAIVSVFSAELDGLLAEYEQFKQRAAVLDFDDLLFTCRDVLCAYPQVLAAASDRFPRILVDEFQDTDPVQAEIMFLLSSTYDQAETWYKRRLKPGCLFMVGDPKQAIYRFRGADLATYLLVRRAMEAQFPTNVLRVTANFRSRSQILNHINRCFAERLAHQEAGYVDLRSTRDAPDHNFPCVAKVTIELPPNSRVDDSRDEEARVIAEICARLIGNVELKLNDGTTRRMAPGDIALLAPVSTDLWRYERVLEEAGLPFASQAGKNLFRRQEAQDLVALVRILADPCDTLALGSLLRGPLVGLTEQELLTITENLSAPQGLDFARLSLRTDPATIQHNTAREVVIILRELRRRVRSTSPALLLAEAIERLRVRAIVAARSVDQAARALANIDGLLERARSYRVRGFTQFARDLDDDWSSGAGSTEGMVEADGQSIEIVTVHSSKGLEWPVVIPINRGSMPRRAEPFVYRRSDDSLHWALGQVTPPTLEGALQGENEEKHNENVRLLYVACTRAMELLIIPDFTWSNDASWVRQLDFKLVHIPELKVNHLQRCNLAAPTLIENQQTGEVFAGEQSCLERAFQRIRWIQPSDGDPDIVPIQLPPSLGDDEPLQASSAINGSRMRGVILHKLMEELLTEELEGTSHTVKERARSLCDQLAPTVAQGASPEPEELASTALRTLALLELKPFRDRLVPEVPIFGLSSTGIHELIAGRADAVAWAEDGGKVAFDWKSDVAPSDADRTAYAHQLGHYLHVLGAKRGGVVYMTSGHIDWVTTRP